jgi:ribosomal protein S27AE
MEESEAYPVYFADCPYCDEGVELDGEPPCEQECPDCGKTFLANT